MRVALFSEQQRATGFSVYYLYSLFIFYINIYLRETTNFLAPLLGRRKWLGLQPSKRLLEHTRFVVSPQALRPTAGLPASLGASGGATRSGRRGANRSLSIIYSLSAVVALPVTTHLALSWIS